MRIVWLVGASSAAQTKLEAALTRDAAATTSFVVRVTNSAHSIPREHLSNPGVCVLLDAFSTDLKGLSGVRWLREQGFRGPLYLFGEPATEEAQHAFAKDGLTGFFAPFERVDFDFLAGLLHSSIDFDGAVQITRFIMPGGRSAQETIRTLKEFNSFVSKFSAFVGRFGIDVDQLRKVLMALSLPHVKSEGGAPVVEHPFTITYGMDPLKIVLAAPSFSRGANLESLQASYSAAVGSLSSPRPTGGALFPEFHHLARATQNLILLCGSSHSADRLTLDPVVLLTTVPFPAKDIAIASSYFFSFHHVVPTEEILEEAVHTPTSQQTPAAPVAEAPVEEAPPPAPDHHEAPPPESFIQTTDVGDLLAEPKLVGDAPVIVEDGAPAAAGFDLSATTDEASQEVTIGVDGMSEGFGEGAFPTAEASALQAQLTDLQARFEELQAENERLKKTSDAMGEDIRRLMKERRQPTTDRELRDSNLRLQEQNQTLTLEKMKALELVGTREKQIELMKVQIETIKKESKAA